MNALLPIPQALEVFLRGFSTTRSFIRPYLVSQIDSSLWLLADPPSASGPQRTVEAITYNSDPEAVVQTLQNLNLPRYALCVLVEDAAAVPETCTAYKQLGYRFHGREPLFALDIGRRVRFNSYDVRRVIDAANAEKVAKAARARQIFPEHLTEADSICRVYAAFDGDTPIGWARSIRTHPDYSWVAGLFVQPSYRRQGIGRTLMSTMLDDDARYGVKWSVLTASSAGAKLYPHLGYVERGLLLIFSPRKNVNKEGGRDGDSGNQA
ncbi:MAG TPA: GNAT family N-acetyltransferase [Chthonomonadaceae bacterium]|nr:GNAT family N-acetyltransferase [Chthonomonadaceae bacterium]